MEVATPLLAATLPTVAAIIALGVTDPKRKRTSSSAGVQLSLAVRRGVALAGLAPGVALSLAGGTAALLIWLGIASITGWAMATMLALGNERDREGTAGQSDDRM